MKRRKLSERRSCALAGISRSAFRYAPKPKDDSLVRLILRLALKNQPLGYRRITRLILNEGVQVNHKTVYRIWKQQRLSLPRKKRRGKTKTPDPSPLQAQYPNHVWSYDFMYDTTTDRRPFKILTLIDEFTRECLALEVGRSFKSEHVIQTLTKLVGRRSAPDFIRSDNGPEFISKPLRNWIDQQGASTYFIAPGRPWQNAFNESFNGKFRTECLNREWFSNLNEARIVVHSWQRYYNQQRPHSSLDYQTPAQFYQQFLQQKHLKPNHPPP